MTHLLAAVARRSIAAVPDTVPASVRSAAMTANGNTLLLNWHQAIIKALMAGTRYQGRLIFHQALLQQWLPPTVFKA